MVNKYVLGIREEEHAGHMNLVQDRLVDAGAESMGICRIVGHGNRSQQKEKTKSRYKLDWSMVLCHL